MSFRIDERLKIAPGHALTKGGKAAERIIKEYQCSDCPIVVKFPAARRRIGTVSEPRRENGREHEDDD
jgi:hypothetical protein